jgi:hypothetical protein
LKRGSLTVAVASVAAAMPVALVEAGDAGDGAVSAVPAGLSEGSAVTQPLVAHVRDLSTGQISLFLGTREITVQDPHLAAHLFNASH